MSQEVHLSDQLVNGAKRYAGINSRSVPKQIEYRSRTGKIVEENPDLPYAFIKVINDLTVG
jgi:ParD-like antitoxin of type II bacterial toxin-antitoxin system